MNCISLVIVGDYAYDHYFFGVNEQNHISLEAKSTKLINRLSQNENAHPQIYNSVPKPDKKFQYTKA